MVVGQIGAESVTPITGEVTGLSLATPVAYGRLGDSRRNGHAMQSTGPPRIPLRGGPWIKAAKLAAEPFGPQCCGNSGSCFDAGEMVG